MRRSLRIRNLFYITFTVIFLSVIPFAVCRAANTSSPPSSICSSNSSKMTYTFHQNVTVKMLRDQLAAQRKDLRLAVFSADGKPKSSGNIVTGDIIETIDRNDNVFSAVIALVIIDEGSSSVPQSSIPQSSSSVPQSSSSVPQSSSSVPQSSVPQSSSSVPSGKSKTVFVKTVTLEDLAKQLLTQPQYNDSVIKVTTPGGKRRSSGRVCTGDTICILDTDGNAESETKAVILGDLTRCGAATRQGSKILYDYLIYNGSVDDDILSAADMNRDGSVNTSDLLIMKKTLIKNSKDVD